MKVLTSGEANRYLRTVGLVLDDWSRVTGFSPATRKVSVKTFKAPRDARELYSLAMHAVGWQLFGSWVLLQLDNSAVLSFDEAYLVSRVLGIPETPNFSDAKAPRSFLIERVNDTNVDELRLLQVAYFIYSLLLFESHGYVVCSGSASGQFLAIQDGSLHFAYNQQHSDSVESLLRGFESQPSRLPKWVTEIIANHQPPVSTLKF